MYGRRRDGETETLGKRRRIARTMYHKHGLLGAGFAVDVPDKRGGLRLGVESERYPGREKREDRQHGARAHPQRHAGCAHEPTAPSDSKKVYAPC